MDILSLKQEITACLEYDDSSEFDDLRRSDARLRSDAAFKKYLEGTLELIKTLKEGGFKFIHKSYKIIHINKVELKNWKKEQGDWYLQFGVSQVGTLSLKFVKKENGSLTWQPSQTANEDLLRVFTRKYIKDLQNGSSGKGVIQSCILRKRENDLVRIANNQIWENRLQKGCSFDCASKNQHFIPDTLKELSRNEYFMNMIIHGMEGDDQGKPWPITSTMQALVEILSPGDPGLDFKTVIRKMASQTPGAKTDVIFDAIQKIGRADVVNKLGEQFTRDSARKRQLFQKPRAQSLDAGRLGIPQEAIENEDISSRERSLTSPTDAGSKAFPIFDSQPPDSITDIQNLRKNRELFDPTRPSGACPEQDSHEHEISEHRNLEKNRQLFEERSQMENPEYQLTTQALMEHELCGASSEACAAVNPGYPLTNQALTEQGPLVVSNENSASANPGYPLTADSVTIQKTVVPTEQEQMDRNNVSGANPGYPETRSAVNNVEDDS